MPSLDRESLSKLLILAEELSSAANTARLIAVAGNPGSRAAGAFLIRENAAIAIAARHSLSGVPVEDNFNALSDELAKRRNAAVSLLSEQLDGIVEPPTETDRIVLRREAQRQRNLIAEFDALLGTNDDAAA